MKKKNFTVILLMKIKFMIESKFLIIKYFEALQIYFKKV